MRVLCRFKSVGEVIVYLRPHSLGSKKLGLNLGLSPHEASRSSLISHLTDTVSYSSYSVLWTLLPFLRFEMFPTPGTSVSVSSPLPGKTHRLAQLEAP